MGTTLQMVCLGVWYFSRLSTYQSSDEKQILILFHKSMRLQHIFRGIVSLLYLFSLHRTYLKCLRVLKGSRAKGFIYFIPAFFFGFVPSFCSLFSLSNRVSSLTHFLVYYFPKTFVVKWLHTALYLCTCLLQADPCCHSTEWRSKSRECGKNERIWCFISLFITSWGFYLSSGKVKLADQHLKNFYWFPFAHTPAFKLA